MKKKHIITIAGRPGSGKSTTAKRVATNLGFEHFSSGDLFREIAKKQGIDLLQANLSAEKNTAVDDLVDEKLREIGRKKDKLVIDSRMAWHWMPYSFKIFLDLDLEVAAERILSSMDKERLNSENIDNDPLNYSQILKQRLDSEARRYQALYQINPYDKTNYDLVIDTAMNSIEEVVKIVTKSFREWIEE